MLIFSQNPHSLSFCPPAWRNRIIPTFRKRITTQQPPASQCESLPYRMPAKSIKRIMGTGGIKATAIRPKGRKCNLIPPYQKATKPRQPIQRGMPVGITTASNTPAPSSKFASSVFTCGIFASRMGNRGIIMISHGRI